MDQPEHLCLSDLEARLADERGRYVARIDSDRRATDENRTIARRLAAAWNALRDIPTESLEAVANQSTALDRMNALARVPFPQEAV